LSVKYLSLIGESMSIGRPKVELEKKYVPDPNTGCWLWLGYWHPLGYGRTTVKGRPVRAHRYVYELLVGPIPAGMQLCHKCDTRPCVNPEHMFVGTCKENSDDAVRKGRKCRGSTSGRAKLSDKDILEIRNMGTKDAVSKFGISRSQAWAIRKKLFWSHVGEVG
jgi:hypothetical protein